MEQIAVRGPWTPYRPKAAPAVSFRLTRAASKALSDACSRLWGRARGKRMASLVIEHLIRTRASSVRTGAETVEAGDVATATLTQVAKDKLRAVAERTARGRSAIACELLERFAADIRISEFPREREEAGQAAGRSSQ